MDYETRPRGYLCRARKRLDEGTRESLIYAALELRCGVEGRLREYVAFAEGGMEAGQVKLDWQIRKLRARVSQYVQTPGVAISGLRDARGVDTRQKIQDDWGPLEDLVFRFALHDSYTRRPLGSMFYTPVTGELAKEAERLGEVLHVQGVHGDAWWSEIQQSLEATYTKLKQALSGSMVYLPEVDPFTGWPKGLHQDQASPTFSNIETSQNAGITVRIYKSFPEEEISLDWRPHA